jgi:hypothetical protein
MSNIFDMEAAMGRFSYQERSLLGVLAADLLVYVPYLLHGSHSNTLGSIAGTMLLLMLLQIVLQVGIAIATRNVLQDERDELITLRGYRAGYIAFATCVTVCLVALVMHDAIGLIDPKRITIDFLGVLFGMLVVADIVRAVAQLIDYRRAV